MAIAARSRSLIEPRQVVEREGGWTLVVICAFVPKTVKAMNAMIGSGLDLFQPLSLAARWSSGD
jgi:hypothetical protein